MARGWHGNPEGHARAGRKGGAAVSQDRNHMAEIGRKGGRASSGNFSFDPGRASEAGQKGGSHSKGKKKTHRDEAQPVVAMQTTMFSDMPEVPVT